MTNAADLRPARPAILHVHPDHLPGAHRTDSADFIYWYLPILGPSSTLCARILAASVAGGDTGWSTRELAGLLGLGGRNGGAWPALDRLHRFYVIGFVATDVVTVRLAMPALRAHQLDQHPHGARYPADLQREVVR